MADLGELKVRIGVAVAEFRKQMAQAQAEVRGFAAKTGRTMARLQARIATAAKRMGASLTRAFRLASAAIAAAMVVAGKAAVGFASDATESMNLFREVMGESADASEAWSQQLSDDLNLNATQIRKWLATFQLIIEGQGVSTEQSLEMSKALTQLTVDLSSFRNLEFEEAFRKISSGIVGMSRPLRDVGITLTDTAVKQHALETGLIATDREMTEQEKTLGRFGLLLRRTEKDQGDFIRTQDDFANASRSLADAFRTAGEQFGSGLLEPLGIGMADISKMLKDSAEDFRFWGSVVGAVLKGTAGAFSAFIKFNDVWIKSLTDSIAEATQRFQNFRTEQGKKNNVFRREFQGFLGVSDEDITRVSIFPGDDKGKVKFATAKEVSKALSQSSENRVDKRNRELKEASEELTAALAAQGDVAAITSDAMARLKEQYASSAEATTTLTAESDGLFDRFQNKLPEAVDRLRDGMSDVFSDAILQAQSLKDILRNLGDLLARIAVQTAVSRAVGGLFNTAGLFGTSGGTVDVNHAGGIVGQTARKMKLPAMIPRFHGGLERNESLAVLERGERITPAGSEPSLTLNVSSPDPIEAEVTNVRSTFEGMVADVIVRLKRRRDPRLAGI